MTKFNCYSSDSSAGSDSSDSSEESYINDKKNVTKLKKLNCDKTLKLKLGQNSKTQFGTKLKNTNCYITQNLKLLPNSKTQILTKLKKLKF